MSGAAVSSLPCLNENTNFSTWKFRVKLILEEKQVEYVLTSNDVEKPQWKKDDAKARSIITQSLSDKYVELIKNGKTAKDMITLLESIFERKIVTFNVSVIRENARCRSSQEELALEEGSTVILNASTPIRIKNATYEHIQMIKCTFNNGTGNYELGQKYDRRESNASAWREEQIVKKHMFGTWTCKLQYNENCHFGEIKPIEKDRTYSYVVCTITVKKPDVFVSTTTAAPTEMPMNTKMRWIIAGVGALVMLIIIGQAIALCYFRTKAQPRRRMDDMTTRSRLDRGDRARYSAPPCKKGKTSARAEADTDSHIYEMVGVNALYNKSSDLDPEANTAAAERTIRDRPPLSLPHEIPKPVLLSANETLPRHKATPITSMPSTLSLNSTSLGSNLISKKKGKELPPLPGQGFKKAPARPPKQVDEESMPGSLRRPAMPLPAPTPAAAPAPAPIKTFPKKPSTESPMSELKNIFNKRNAGKDTSTSSPAATVKRKERPKVQAKPSTLIKSPKKQPPDATTNPVSNTHTPAVKPINQTNQIKLILPKIEASLKTPKPLVPKPVNPTTSPIKSPPTPMKKLSQGVPQKPIPSPVKQLPPVPIQKRPLPTPETSRKLPPEPISSKPIPPLTPLYQASHEGQSPNTDNEEEWTYEPLGEYNIYNI